MKNNVNESIKKSKVDYADNVILSYREYKDFKKLQAEHEEGYYNLLDTKINKNDSIQTY